MFDLTGKKAIVTGSTQGIGFAIAKALHDAGAEVWIHGATSEEKCKKAVAEIGCKHYVVKNLADRDAAEVIYTATGDLDIVVSNASVQFREHWNEITRDQLDMQMAVNFAASLGLMQKYFPHMKASGFGRIVTVGSVQQYKPHVDMAVYAASKDAQMSLVRNVAKQVAPYGITVNNLCPGVIATPRNDAALSDPEYSKKVMAGIPAGYAGLAEDCAPAALFLCSEESRYVTGSEIIVDGGMHL